MMGRNATDRDSGENPGGLSPAQEAAIDALVTGATVTAAAETAGVARQTVSRWLQSPVFRASLNRSRLELRQSALNRAAALADSALDVVSASLKEGNAKVALELLRGLGLLSGEAPKIGSGDPRAVALDQADREDRHRANVAVSDMLKAI